MVRDHRRGGVPRRSCSSLPRPSQPSDRGNRSETKSSRNHSCRHAGSEVEQGAAARRLWLYAKAAKAGTNLTGIEGTAGMQPRKQPRLGRSWR